MWKLLALSGVRSEKAVIGWRAEHAMHSIISWPKGELTPHICCVCVRGGRFWCELVV